MHVYMNSMEVNDETLGLDSLMEGGPGEHMFGTAHTLRHYETAYWDSALNDDQPWETWSEAGSEDSMTRANRLWKKTLAEYEAPHLDEGTDEALQDFMARKKASMEDAWY